MDKNQVANVLEDVASLLELKEGSNPFEARAYENAARAVSALDGDIEQLTREGKLKGVPGLGATIIKRIEELVNTGQMALYDELVADTPQVKLDMRRIQGVGPKKINVIYNQLHVQSIAELEQACKEDKVAVLPGFGKKTQDKILQGIALLAQHVGRFLYPVAEDEAEHMYQALSTIPEIVRKQVAGSLRRKRETIGDIDMVVSVADDAGEAIRHEIMDVFTGQPNVQAITGKGDTKSSVVLKSGINMTINDYGLFRGKEPHLELVPCKNEADIYAALGMAYIEPELREDMGEIEAAIAGKLPTLVQMDDLQGILHVHSTWSDGQNTIREMAEACIARGYHYLGMTDHSKVAAYAGGLNEDALRRQGEEIDRLNEEFAGRIHILKGTECDILRDGSLDFSDETLASLDFVVASIHSLFNLPPEEQTQRMLRAIANPYVDIIGHPTGRILLGREGYTLDIDAIIDAAAGHGGCIEINAHPSRLDLDWRYLHRARDKGIKIPVDPDAHRIDGLDVVQYGINIARKGWLRPADVLNTLSTRAIQAYFRARRKHD